MKLNCWLLFGVMLSTSLLAQQVADAPPSAPLGTSAPAAAPSGAAKAPAKKTAKKAGVPKKDPAIELRTVPLVPGPAVVDANNVNVRGQAKLKSEIVSRLSKGQTVVVIEEITHNNSAADEPSAWAKILIPTNTHAWVNSSFIDPTNKTVLPRRLNVRSGPGENYSVLGRLLRGEAVVEAGGSKAGWLEIQPPTNAYAFVAAAYLKQEAPATVPATPATPAEPAATPATVTEPPVVAAAPTEPPAPAPGEVPAVTNAVPEVASTNAVPVAEEPPPKRIVQRQGVVRGTGSIQAPTPFALFSVGSGRMVDYLYTTSPNLDLRRYKGLEIIVTGEEGIEERWGNTPVITIQKIQVVE